MSKSFWEEIYHELIVVMIICHSVLGTFVDGLELAHHWQLNLWIVGGRLLIKIITGF